MKRIICLFLTVPLLLCACTGKGLSNGSDFKPDSKNEDYVYAVWLSYMEIAELCRDKTEKEFRDEIINLAANLKSIKVNTLIVHAVAFCDAFFESEILPASRYVRTDGNYDVFGIICEICSLADIKIQAWINPFRVFTDGDSSVTDNPVSKRLYKESKRNILETKNGIYLNPASMSVQRLILDEARELIEKYDIGAIHIDDYFYPDISDEADKSSYESYLKSGGSLSRENWRRENINTLIHSLSNLTQTNNIELAVSPSANIQKNYEKMYADVSLWIENGWADEIIPQIYFGFENENAPFEETLSQWTELVKNKPTRLIIGLAFYKCGKEDINAGTGKNEWKNRSNIISRQIVKIRAESTIYGVAFFSYSHIFGKKIEKIAKKELQNVKNVI